MREIRKFDVPFIGVKRSAVLRFGYDYVDRKNNRKAERKRITLRSHRKGK